MVVASFGSWFDHNLWHYSSLLFELLLLPFHLQLSSKLYKNERNISISSSLICQMPTNQNCELKLFNDILSTSTCRSKRDVIYRRKSLKHSFRRSSSSLFNHIYHRTGSRPRRKRKPAACSFGNFVLHSSSSDLPVSNHSHVDDFIQCDTSLEGASCLVSGGESMQSINHNWTRDVFALV